VDGVIKIKSGRGEAGGQAFSVCGLFSAVFSAVFFIVKQ